MKCLKGCEKSRKKLKSLLLRLEGKALIVEGKRDVEALARLGYSAYAAAGKAKVLAQKLAGVEAVVLTDLDKAGDELALLVKAELEPYASCDIETRKALGSLLGVKHFEDIVDKLEKFNEDYPEGD